MESYLLAYSGAAGQAAPDPQQLRHPAGAVYHDYPMIYGWAIPVRVADPDP
jgi:hypothetical protein